MCGIAGLAGDGAAQQASVVQRMTDALARRGPNGSGVELWPNAVLGHRRLSIFDLSDAGRQPMVTADGNLAVVFNGAIYNFLDLKQELSARGAIFRSRTDTEVLLHGYRAWGIDGLVERLRGMYAIGLWDEREQLLYLIRDRLGVKPLYYAQQGSRIAFASTAEALWKGGCAADLDENALLEYLEFGFVTDQRSIYAGVSKVPPATILEWRGGALSQRTYWKSCESKQSSPRKFEEIVDQTEQALLEAVRLRLEADVPVGALLSGGVDSSLVCWAISKLHGNLRAFTVGTPGDELDETADARRTAEQLGLPHSIIPLGSPEPASAVPADPVPAEMNELAAAYGEPFACSSALGMLRVAQAVRQHATVLLTGDGGDDVFLGYPEHKHFWMAERLARRLPAAAADVWPALAKALPMRSGWGRRAAHFLDYATGGLGSVTRVHDGLPGYGQMLGARLKGLNLPVRQIPKSIQSARRLVADFAAYDQGTRFTGEYLPKVDGGTMYWALEARSPFLDQNLWNFAASLPVDVRLHRGVLKAILREIAMRRLGPRVARGAKRGFHIPARQWLAGKWKPAFERLLEGSELEREGIAHAPAVRKQLDHAGQAGRATLQLWYLFVLEVWLRRRRAQLNA